MPVTPSPAVGRAAHLLKLLAAEPRTEFTLSELARRADLSRASCHTLILALAATGLVSRREPGATYKLGPALVALGEAAKVSMDIVGLAESELAVLRDRFGFSGMAGVVSGDDIVVLTAVSSPHPLGYSIAAGTRVPLRAPIGSVYVAWADDATVDAWCNRADPPLARRTRTQIVNDLTKIRTRGWCASTRPIATSSAWGHGSVHELTNRELEARSLHMAGISAPVWDSGGRLACSLALTAFPTDLSGEQVCEIAAAVKAAAHRLTDQLGGRSPPGIRIPDLSRA